MAIYELFEEEKVERFTETFDGAEAPEKGKKGSVFSTLLTRGCFALLLIADLLWFVYAALMLVFSALLFVSTVGKVAFFRRALSRSWLNLRRSVVCALSLVIGLFCPPFGIMIACTFFLMYDKAGMEEVVPAPLQAQFKDLFHSDL